MIPKYKQTQRYYATQYSRSVRTIAEYMVNGAPLDSPDDMSAWMEVRAMKGKQSVNLPAVDEDLFDKVPLGAAEALRRLEKEEAKASVVFELAQAGGDSAQIEAARLAWLKQARELRYFDKAVDVERRDGFELIPKAEAADAFKAICFQFSAILFKTIDHVIGDGQPEKRNFIRAETISRLKENLYLFQTKWPKWTLQAIDRAFDLDWSQIEDSETVMEGYTPKAAKVPWCHYAFNPDGTKKPEYENRDGRYVLIAAAEGKE